MLADGAPKRVRVKAGVSDDNYVEIVGGELAAGDKLIVGERSDGSRQSRAGQNVLRLTR